MSEKPLGSGNAPTPGLDSPDYSVNFFKPKTAHSKANVRMIVIMVLVWAIAVFGFQFMLILFNQPTPEESYTTFESVWGNVKSGNASTLENQAFAKATLSALGKHIVLSDAHKHILKDAFTQTVLALLPADQHAIITGESSPEAAALATTAIGLETTGFDKLRSDYIPDSLLTAPSQQLSAEIPAIMELYLVHNQSFLTDFRFIGFPFHYWYTSQFLLILFVGLCLIYAYLTDRSNEKYDFPDE
jgi:putative solute:sodium symporter small subunit